MALWYAYWETYGIILVNRLFAASALCAGASFLPVDDRVIKKF